MNLRGTAGVLAATVLMGGLVTGLNHPAYADNTPLPGVRYELFLPFFNSTHFKCLDVPAGNGTLGTRLQVFGCHGFDGHSPNQLWFLENLGTDNSGPYQIRSEATGLCVNLVLNDDGPPGTPAIENTCFGAGTGLAARSGQWVLRHTADPGQYFELSSVRQPSECLATSNLSGNDGTGVVLADCMLTDRSTDGWKGQVRGLG
jgi:hypothetical protein